MSAPNGKTHSITRASAASPWLAMILEAYSAALDVVTTALHNNDMAPRERTNAFQVRMGDDERAMVEALADDAGLSASDIVRLLIREAYRMKFGDKKPKTK